MKVLCVCANGNSRSVALAYILKRDYHFDALAMGLSVSGEDTQKMLFEWADWVLLTDNNFADFIPGEYKSKLKVYDVGEDVFFRGFKKELMNLFYQHLKDNPI